MNIVKNANSNNNLKLRSNMIKMKKIIMHYIMIKVKKLTSQILRHNVWLAFNGIDAANLHFTNKKIYTPTIELVLIEDYENTKNSAKRANYQGAMAELSTVLLDELNEVVLGLNNEGFDEIKNILSECNVDDNNFSQYSYFSKIISEDKACINFNYYLENERNPTQAQTPQKQTFLNIICMKNAKHVPLERYGIRYIFLHDIFHQQKLTQDEENNLDRTLSRSELTFGMTTVDNILRLCFPCVDVQKTGSVTKSTNQITALIRNAPYSYTRELKDLEDKMKDEVRLTKNDKDKIITIITIDEIIHRSVILGIFPNFTLFNNAIKNEYNKTIINEVLIELMG